MDSFVFKNVVPLKVSLVNCLQSNWSYIIDFSVDGELKCDKWIRDDNNETQESRMKLWLHRLIGRPNVNWPYAFAEGKQFVLIITAGLEGYHVNVDGRHVTSFPYRTVSLFMELCKDCSQWCLKI